GYYIGENTELLSEGIWISMAKKPLALIRQRLNVTTATGDVTLLGNAGHKGIRGIEMEMLQEGSYQWRLLQMP
ncbi:hypothetical protein Tco_0297353, partial [Tanacetum coccineum]